MLWPTALAISDELFAALEGPEQVSGQARSAAEAKAVEAMRSELSSMPSLPQRQGVPLGFLLSAAPPEQSGLTAVDSACRS